MANRTLNHSYGIEKQLVQVFAKVTFGASGAPTLSLPASKGIKSVVRNSAGNFTFTFGNSAAIQNSLDTYKKFLSANTLSLSSSAPAAPVMYVTSDQSAVFGTAAITVQFAAPSGTNGALVATDPASGEVSLLEFTFGNSSAY